MEIESTRRPGIVAATIRLVRRVAEELAQDDLAGLAAQMTYYFTLAFFPLLILLVGVLDLLPLEREVPQLTAKLVEGFPADMQPMLKRFLREFLGRQGSGGIFVWMLVALWAGSRAISGARRGLNGVLRQRRKRHPVKLRLQDLGFTLAALLFVGASYVLTIGGRAFGNFLADQIGFGAVFETIWRWSRWPSSIALLTLFLALAYRYLPDRNVRWRAAFAGALPSCLGWLGLLGGYEIWLRLAGNFDRIYGSLTSFFLLMLMLWLFALIFLLGGEIVAWRSERHDGRSVDPTPTP